MPSSFEITLMKKDCGVLSQSKTSMRPVCAQKLMPCFTVDVTMHPAGSSLEAVNMKTILRVRQGLVAYPSTRLSRFWYCPPRIQGHLRRCSSFPGPKSVLTLFSVALVAENRVLGEGSRVYYRGPFLCYSRPFLYYRRPFLYYKRPFLDVLTMIVE